MGRKNYFPQVYTVDYTSLFHRHRNKKNQVKKKTGILDADQNGQEFRSKQSQLWLKK